MEIERYAGYFHDGGIFNIINKDNQIIIEMETCELEIGENICNASLSFFNSLRGKLYINYTKIFIDDSEIKKLTMNGHDRASIFDLEFYENYLVLDLIWKDYPPKNKLTMSSIIKIEFESYYWETIPDLVDPCW